MQRYDARIPAVIVRKKTEAGMCGGTHAGFFVGYAELPWSTYADNGLIDKIALISGPSATIAPISIQKRRVSLRCSGEVRFNQEEIEAITESLNESIPYTKACPLISLPITAALKKGVI